MSIEDGTGQDKMNCCDIAETPSSHPSSDVLHHRPMNSPLARLDARIL
jgi:hypothetical protein